jgi:hypothetical protein
VITASDQCDDIEKRLREISGVIDVLKATPGGGVEIVG